MGVLSHLFLHLRRCRQMHCLRGSDDTSMLFWSFKKWLSISCYLKIGGVCLIHSLGFQSECCNAENSYSYQQVKSSSDDSCVTKHREVQIVLNDRGCLWGPLSEPWKSRDGFGVGDILEDERLEQKEQSLFPAKPYLRNCIPSDAVIWIIITSLKLEFSFILKIRLPLYPSSLIFSVMGSIVLVLILFNLCSSWDCESLL